MDEFTESYIKTALWASLDDGGKPLDDDHTPEDIDPALKLRMMDDCTDFQRQHAADITENPSLAGHDFWLTRNGHGAGFWDGDWPEEAGERLSEASRAVGECHLLIGDDGKIHGLWDK